jgi:hypothetical protein
MLVLIPFELSILSDNVLDQVILNIKLKSNGIHPGRHQTFG